MTSFHSMWLSHSFAHSFIQWQWRTLFYLARTRSKIQFTVLLLSIWILEHTESWFIGVCVCLRKSAWVKMPCRVSTTHPSIYPSIHTHSLMAWPFRCMCDNWSISLRNNFNIHRLHCEYNMHTCDVFYMLRISDEAHPSIVYPPNPLLTNVFIYFKEKNILFILTANLSALHISAIPICLFRNLKSIYYADWGSFFSSLQWSPRRLIIFIHWFIRNRVYWKHLQIYILRFFNEWTILLPTCINNTHYHSKINTQFSIRKRFR